MNTENLTADITPGITVLGQPFNELPRDLYIPPDALEVILEAFSGPLDLLLYLIRKENINILDIPVAQITAQYTEYVELMRHMNLDLAAEYLVMAAMLAEIKSRMLLPRPANIENDEADPRAELVRRLREYERFKQAAIDLDNLPRVERELFPIAVDISNVKAKSRVLPPLELQALLRALGGVMLRASRFVHHHVKRETLSVRERMSEVLATLQQTEFVGFENMFKVEEGKLGVIVTFVAILELLHQSLIEIVQAEIYGPIYLRTVNSEENQYDGRN